MVCNTPIYVAVHNIGVIADLQEVFVQCTKIAANRVKLLIKCGKGHTLRRSDAARAKKILYKSQD
jgi:hypothetical protein